MLVCAHGDVADFCSKNDMVIVGQYDGEIEDYRGTIKILVTDQEMSECEYYYKKGKMLGMGIELISIRYKDDKLLTRFLGYQAERRKEKYGGRQPFGFRKIKGEVVLSPEGREVACLIIKMRDAGLTLRTIQACREVCHPDGRRISLSTIQQIIKNRDMYENE